MGEPEMINGVTMMPDHQRPEKHRAGGCLILAIFASGLVCAGACLATAVIVFLRGSWWN